MYFLIGFGILSPFILQSVSCIIACYSSEHIPSFQRFPMGTIFFFNNGLLPYLISTLIDQVIDSIIGPNSSLPCNGIIYPYVCLLALLCSSTACGIIFPTPHDFLWQWKISRCHRSKDLTYICQGLAWLLYSGSARREHVLIPAAFLALAQVWAYMKTWAQTIVWI